MQKYFREDFKKTFTHISDVQDSIVKQNFLERHKNIYNLYGFSDTTVDNTVSYGYEIFMKISNH